MIERRFKATYEDGHCVHDEETDLLYHMDNEMITKKMSNLLNQLNDENVQLKEDKQSLIDFIKKEFPKSHKHILEGLEWLKINDL